MQLNIATVGDTIDYQIDAKAYSGVAKNKVNGPVPNGWLIALPFAGVVVDIATMWLKAFVSPVFFWLHIPGGGFFYGGIRFRLFSGDGRNVGCP